LRPGNVTASAGAVGILRRLMGMIRGSFPKARIRVRLDGGFAHPALLEFLDAEPNVEYVVAMASNAVLQSKAEEGMQYACILVGVTGQTAHVYGEADYAAGSWKRERRMIVKAEVVPAEGKEPKDNPRFVITNMRQSPQWIDNLVAANEADVVVGEERNSAAALGACMDKDDRAGRSNCDFAVRQHNCAAVDFEGR